MRTTCRMAMGFAAIAMMRFSPRDRRCVDLLMAEVRAAMGG